MKPQALMTDRWRSWHFAAAALMGLVGIAATFDAWADILRIAMKDEESSHIFIVPIVAVWLIWVRRARLRHVRPAFTLLGPIIVGVGWACSYYGFHRLTPQRIAELDWPLRAIFWPMWKTLDAIGAGHAGQVLWHGGAVLIVLGCVLSVLGKNVLFRFFPAVALLAFMIPVPGDLRLKIALPLERWTAQISQVVLSLAGTDVERSGNVLALNGQPVTIAEACNGLRMVFALILVVYAFAFGMPLRNRVRVLLLLASPIAAIACNVPRICANAVIYGYFDANIGRQFHDYSGWLMLPIAFLLLYSLIKLMRWAMIPVERYTLASQPA